MSLWSWTVAKLRGWKLEEYAEDIAIHALETVWRKVAHRVGTMNLAEARGYIRARAGVVLTQEADSMICRTTQLHSHRTRLIHLASDMLINRLERRVFEAQRVVLPRRRAA